MGYRGLRRATFCGDTRACKPTHPYKGCGCSPILVALTKTPGETLKAENNQGGRDQEEGRMQFAPSKTGSTPSVCWVSVFGVAERQDAAVSRRQTMVQDLMKQGLPGIEQGQHRLTASHPSPSSMVCPSAWRREVASAGRRRGAYSPIGRKINKIGWVGGGGTPKNRLTPSHMDAPRPGSPVCRNLDSVSKFYNSRRGDDDQEEYGS
jgi:hypothetical protein